MTRSPQGHAAMPQLATPLRTSLPARLIAVLLAVLTLTLSNVQPAQARFLSPDPWDPWIQGVDINRYAYSNNDPINLSDPNGHAIADFWDPYDGLSTMESLEADTSPYTSAGEAWMKNPEIQEKSWAQAKTTMAVAGAAIAAPLVAYAAAESGAAALVGAATKVVISKVKAEAKKVRFEGPELNEYGQGKLVQVRYGGGTFIVRLDYKGMKGSQKQPRLHLNIQIGKATNLHISLDPRTLVEKGSSRNAPGPLRSFFDRLKDLFSWP